MDGFIVSPYGTRIGVRFSKEGASQRYIDSLLSPGWETVDNKPVADLLYSVVVGGPGKKRGSRDYHVAYAGSQVLARSLKEDDIHSALWSEMHRDVAKTATTHTFYTGASLVYEGKGIILPGLSGTGRTNLAKALVELGCVLYSDNFFVVDTSHRLHAYTAPLRECQEKKCTFTPLENFGWSRDCEPTKITIAIETQFEEGISRPNFETMQPSRAALTLTSFGMTTQYHPARDLKLAAEISQSIPFYTGSRGEASETAKEILRLLETT